MKKLSLVAAIFMLATIGYMFLPSHVAGKNEKLIRTNNAVPGRYIVVFDTESSDFARRGHSSENAAREIATSYGAKIDAVYDAVLQGFSAEMSEAKALQMSREPGVLFVEEDSIGTVESVQYNADWGLDRIDQRELPLNSSYVYSNTGAGVNVYIIDTGIRPTHQDFGGRAVAAYDIFTDGQNGVDCHGHGTHVAGSVGSSTYGVAKGANLYGVRVLSCTGSGLVSGFINGINWVAANRVNPAVINFSIGVSSVSSSLNTAINNAVTSGITFVAAAGNNNSNACNYSPGSATSAIIVGATHTTDQRAGYSNFGPCLDIFAPGNYITSLSHASDDGIRSMSGTSMASPLVAGAAALYLQTNPVASPAVVANRLMADSTSGVVTNIEGTNSPNRMLYTWLGNTTPPVPGVVTIIKEVVTATGGTASPETFSYSASNLSNTSFSLIDNNEIPADRFVDNGVFAVTDFDQIVVTQEQKFGWLTMSISCVEAGTGGLPSIQNTTVDLATRTANIKVEEGESVTCTFRSQEIGPTSAPITVSGRVVDSMGAGIPNTTVSLRTAAGGRGVTAVTNSFGYYSFDVVSSQFYVLSANAKRGIQFTPGEHALIITESLIGVDFIGVAVSK
ncbi:MAG: S8 family serine peptidase [Blastocatellia bacterium]|nr:S8 family serine peptidase [Blastocatellia bacterium]